jgi:NADPH:quinone reductase-like Zn-dependent oxidoreductase
MSLLQDTVLKKMRAVLIKDDKGPSSLLYLGKASVPTIAHGQVLVCVHALGLNDTAILQQEGKGSGETPCFVSSSLPAFIIWGCSAAAHTKIFGVEFFGLIVEIAYPPQGANGDDPVLRNAWRIWKTGGPVYGHAYGVRVSIFIAISQPRRLSYNS